MVEGSSVAFKLSHIFKPIKILSADQDIPKFSFKVDVSPGSRWPVLFRNHWKSRIWLKPNFEVV